MLHLADKQIILVTNTEEFTVQDFAEQTRQMAALSENTQTFRILADDIAINTRISTTEICEFPKLSKEAGLSLRSKIAVLILLEDRGIDDFKFNETTCQNNGYQSKMIFRYEDALEWSKR